MTSALMLEQVPIWKVAVTASVSEAALNALEQVPIWKVAVTEATSRCKQQKLEQVPIWKVAVTKTSRTALGRPVGAGAYLEGGCDRGRSST